MERRGKSRLSTIAFAVCALPHCASAESDGANNHTPVSTYVTKTIAHLCRSAGVVAASLMMATGAHAFERLPAGTYLTKADVCAESEFGPDKKGNLGPDDFLVVERDGSLSFYEGYCKPKRRTADAFICDNDGAKMKFQVVREGEQVKALRIDKTTYFYCGKVLKPVI